MVTKRDGLLDDSAESTDEAHVQGDAPEPRQNHRTRPVGGLHALGVCGDVGRGVLHQDLRGRQNLSEVSLVK